MNKKTYSFFLILSLIISPSLYAGKSKKNIKQQPKSKIETIITHDSISPIFDPEEFGFSHLKTWSDLNSRKQTAKKRTNADRLNNALKAKEEGNIHLYEHLLREGAKQNCDDAMFYLGCLEEEKENFEEAYTWYMLSFCSTVFKENNLNQQNDAYNKLLSIVNSQKIVEDYKILFNNLIKPEYILDSRINKNKKNIIILFINSLQKSSQPNPRLSAFAFELCKWVDNDGTFYGALGSAFEKQNLNEEAAHCYRLSKTDISLTTLMKLAVTKKIATDINGKKIDPNNISELKQLEVDVILKKKHITAKEFEILGENIITEENLKINGKLIPKNKKHEISASYLRKAKTPKAFELIGELITTNKIQYDEDNFLINPNEKFHIAARNFRKSDSPQSMLNLAGLIYNKQVTQDENGDIIPEELRYGIVEKIAKKHIDLPDSKTLIADLIFNKKTDLDEFNNKILEDQRYKIASRLYLESPNPISYYKISMLIYNDYIDPKEGLKMLGYNEESYLNKDEILAELCRRSGVPDALHALGMQIYKGLTDKDENNINININENQRIQKSYDLLKKSHTKESLFNLAIIKLQDSEIKSIELLRECLSLFKESLLLGYSEAFEWCLILNEEITLLENQNKNISNLHENLPAFETDPDKLNIHSEDTTTSFSTETPEEDTNKFSSQQNNIDEENILSLETRKKIKAAKKAEKIRELFKRKQKHFQLIKNQLPQDQLNDLLINTKKIKTGHKKLHIKWSKKTLDQFNALLSHEKNKVLLLLDDMKENGTMGRPETLKGCDAISRRITQEHRLVYRLHKNNIDILSCKGHYEDKYQ